MIVIDDVFLGGAFTDDPHVRRFMVRAVLCAPLVAKGGVRGALYLENNLIAGAFTQARVELLHLLCRQLVISLENAYLVRDVREANASMRALNAALEGAVLARTETLDAARARLAVLTRDDASAQSGHAFAHEIQGALRAAESAISRAFPDRTVRGAEPHPVVVSTSEELRGLLSAARAGLDDGGFRAFAVHMQTVVTNEERLEASVHAARLALGRARARTERLVAPAPPTTAHALVEVCDAVPVLEAVRALLHGRASRARAALRISAPPSVHVQLAAADLYSILSHLVAQAIDAVAASNRAGHVEVDAARGTRALAVRIVDTGDGVPEPSGVALESVLAAAASEEAENDVAPGMRAVQKLVAAVGATLTFQTVAGAGTTFVVQIPLAAADAQDAA